MRYFLISLLFISIGCKDSQIQKNRLVRPTPTTNDAMIGRVIPPLYFPDTLTG